MWKRWAIKLSPPSTGFYGMHSSFKKSSCVCCVYRQQLAAIIRGHSCRHEKVWPCKLVVVAIFETISHIKAPPKYQRKVAHVSSIVRPVDREFMERRYRESYWDRNMNTHLTQLAASLFSSVPRRRGNSNVELQQGAAAALLFSVTYPRLW